MKKMQRKGMTANTHTHTLLHGFVRRVLAGLEPAASSLGVGGLFHWAVFSTAGPCKAVILTVIWGTFHFCSDHLFFHMSRLLRSLMVTLRYYFFHLHVSVQLGTKHFHFPFCCHLQNDFSSFLFQGTDVLNELNLILFIVSCIKHRLSANVITLIRLKVG